MTEMQDNPSTPSESVRPSRARRSALAVAGATAVAGAVMVVSAMTTGGPANAEPATKYFVCKYVGTPGVNESLQTGQNPISVSANAIGQDPVQVGSFFNDSQGRSFVLIADTGQPEPDPSTCPPPDTGGSTPPPSTTPVSITPSESLSISASATESLPPTVTETVTTPVTETQTISGSVVTTVVNQGGGGAAGQQAGGQGPIPAAVNAGLHTTDSNAGLKAWGILLMLLGGAAGLIVGLRPSRGRAH